MMARVMPKHVFKKLYRELKFFVNTAIVTKLLQNSNIKFRNDIN